MFVRRIFLLCAVGLAACPVEPPIAGRPCASDAECGGGHFCQLELADEPQVCIPGDIGVPPLTNHPPFLSDALIVMTSEDPSSITRAAGVLFARDPDGDAVSFVAGDYSLPDLASLQLAADGSFTLTLNDELLSSGERTTAIDIELLDARGLRVTRQVTVVSGTLGPSPFRMYWRGESSDRFDDPANWEPSGVPDEGGTVVMPNDGNALEVNVDASVNGFTAANDVAIAFSNNAVVTARGTRVVSGTPIRGGQMVLDPFDDVASTVRVGGAFPSLVVDTDAQLLAPVHASGDVVLSNASIVDMSSTAFVVERDLRQDVDGPSLHLDVRSVLDVGGDALLIDGAPSVMLGGVMVVGGDVSVSSGSIAVDVALVLDGAAPQTINVPESFRFGNVTSLAGSTVIFAADANIDDVLMISGGLGVAEDVIVDVDTLALRPAFTNAGIDGEIRARTCIGAYNLGNIDDIPGITCDFLVEPPPPLVDGGVDPDAGPQVPPPNACSLSDQIQSDLVAHGLIVAAVRQTAVSDRFEHLGQKLHDAEVRLRGGVLNVGADGAFEFSAGEIPGEESADVTIDIELLHPDGGVNPPPAVIGGCVDAQIVDVKGMNVLVGVAWDDEASWSFGRLPAAADDVFIAAGIPHEAAAGGPPLRANRVFVSSGASIDLGGRDLEANSAFVGGEMSNGVVRLVGPDASFAGRLPALSCVQELRARADATVSRIDVLDGCLIEIGANRVTVRGNIENARLDLRMREPAGALIVEGAFDVSALGGELTAGELQLLGDTRIGAFSLVASPQHRLILASPNEVRFDAIQYAGFLQVFGAPLQDGVEPPLVLENGGLIGVLQLRRPMVNDGRLVIGALAFDDIDASGTGQIVICPDRSEPDPPQGCPAF